LKAVQLLSRWGEPPDPDANARRRWTRTLLVRYGDADALDYAVTRAGHRAPSVDELLIGWEREERIAAGVWAALDTVTARQREVLILRYGLDSGGQRTHRAVAQLLGISGPAVYEAEQRAMRTLRANVTLRSLWADTR
jgi:DNA-directed RNA polymerase specialized sigma24 family protein